MEQDNISQDLEDANEQAPIENEIERTSKRRNEFIFEMSLFLVLGVLVGITIKTEAIKKITIGFNDYQLTKPAQSYDIAGIKKNLDDTNARQQTAQQSMQQSQLQQQASPTPIE